MSKILWRGSISFGLITIPIELFTAVKEHAISFKILHKVCKTPIRNKRWCDHCDKEVAWDDTVRGLQLEKGKFLIITAETLQKMRPEKSDLLEIVEFVPKEAIPTIYYDQHYYVCPPAHGNHKAFSLFVAALQQMEVVGIAKFIFREKEHMCTLEPYEDILLLTTLNYAYEIQQVPRVGVEKYQAAELTLANQLITKRRAKKFDISDYKDTFAQKLKQHVSKAGKIKVTGAKRKSLATTPRGNLLSLLKASVKTPKRAVAQAKRRR